ncbi:protein kinase domain-containing protein [Nonomuraea sp. LPB2021202275-12-8]|uniref:protein kinase domain-containing protein n=1 Tax=Nonomuraea sp. LPB2021202275-12-8 TaxID=3120159 RepID=UPI00300C17AC
MPTAQPLRTGDPRRLGGYELGGRLGEGGQGVVYLGTRDEDTYAVKLLHGPVGDERAAFLREVELAKHVARFCTAQVVDAGFDDGRAYIVSEYVDGPSLAREVMLTGPRRGGALERLAVGTATAITAIHRAGIVHRDFKPQNVLLGSDGPRVIDFGLARALDAAATLTGRGVGTPAYMAPEQITASAVTGAADVFSWGATMCFAANGTAPFGQDSVAPVLHRILTAQPELGRLDGELRELVEACLDKDSRNRPSSRDLLLALLGGSGGLPAEVLRSPPPHILRATPVPGFAVPPPRTEASSATHPPGEVRVPGADADTSSPGTGLDASPPVTAGSSSSDQDATGPHTSSPGATGGGGSGAADASSGSPFAPMAEPEATGAAHGFRLPEDRRRPEQRAAFGDAEPHGSEAAPERPADETSRQVALSETVPKRRSQALGRAGLAATGALLVSAAVVVTLLAPPLGERGRPSQGGAQPSAADVGPVATVSPVDKSTPIKEKQSAKPRKPPADDPPVVRPVSIPVPPLAGLSRAAAVKAIQRAGLVAGEVTQVDSAKKIGEVLSSRPAAGTAVPEGARVSLQVSAGLRVPTVAGMRRKSAEAALTGAGLAVGSITRTCAPDPNGQVLSSTPKAGSRVSGGTPVSLAVARHGAVVPSVIGQSRENARAALRAAGFTVTMRGQVVEDESQLNLAVAQSVKPGICAKPGASVLVSVGISPQSGPDPTEPTQTPTETPEPPASP